MWPGNFFLVLCNFCPAEMGVGIRSGWIVDWNSSMQLVGRTAHVWNSCTHTSANSFLGIFLLTGALCVGPVSAANIASHRGAYELTLQTTSADSDVASVSGGMTFEWIDKCDAWEVKESYLMRVLKQTSSEVNFVAEYFGWESKDGLRYRFQTKRREAGQVKVIRGNALAHRSWRTGYRGV